LWAWLRNQIQEVPPELAVCEFDCREPECTVRDWRVCPLRNMTAQGYPTGLFMKPHRKWPAFARNHRYPAFPVPLYTAVKKKSDSRTAAQG